MVESRAAVAYEAGQPLTIENVDVAAPREGEVLVEISASIQDVLSESISSPEPIGLAGFDGFNIKGVKVDESTPEYPNQLVMNMKSDFIVPIDFIINMDNFFDDDGNALSEEVEVSGNSVTTIPLADYLIAKTPSESESFSEIYITYDFSKLCIFTVLGIRIAKG